MRTVREELLQWTPKHSATLDSLEYFFVSKVENVSTFMSAILTVITLKHGKFKTEQLCFINLNVSKNLLLLFCVIL